MSVLTGFVAILAMVPLFSVLLMLIWEGGSQLSVQLFTELPPAAGMVGGGIGNALVGTLLIVGIATAISVPVGILAAVYLAEFGPDTRTATVVRFAAKILTGLPSVLAGLFVYVTIVLLTGTTYSGHPLACAAGVATLAAYHEEDLIERARVLGERLFARLGAMAQRHPAVGDVRGKGLFACVELVKDRETREPLTPWTPRGGREPHPAVTGTIRAMRERGVYAYPKWNLIMLAPQFVITDEELDEGLNAIDEALMVADSLIAAA